MALLDAIKVAGVVVKGIVNRARAKRAERKRARAEAREAEAATKLQSLLSTKIAPAVAPAVGLSAMDEKIQPSTVEVRKGVKPGVIAAIVGGVVVLLLLLFKRK